MGGDDCGAVASGKASLRPWYFDGWDIFTTGPTTGTGGHRLVVPLPHDTFHPSQRVKDADAELIVRAVNAYDSMREVLGGLVWVAQRNGLGNDPYVLRALALITATAPQSPPTSVSDSGRRGGGTG